MRLRVCVLACALTALGSLGVSGPASAAPRHNHHLTIAVAPPTPILAGEGVLIYGRLFGPDRGGQPIRLYQRLDGTGTGFAPTGMTANTDSFGGYEFTLPPDVVITNRDWFVRGPDGANSRTVHERVEALVSPPSGPAIGDTSQPIAFTGHISPAHPLERVLLQRQNGSSDDWSTIARGFTSLGSDYLILHRFRVRGAYTLRVVLPRDARNIRSVSDTANVVIQQAQVPDFTINTSAPIVTEQGSTTISGILDEPGTTTPEPNTVVQLRGRQPDQPFTVLGDMTTGQDGSYSFNETGLTTNTVYYVATMRLPHQPRRHTARLFEGVTDVVMMQANMSSGPTDEIITFTGAVHPDKPGHVIYLQKAGKDGNFHTVEIGLVRTDSTFQFTWTLGSPGTYTFRARIPGDKENIGAVSSPVSVTATTPSLTSLPPAS
jgi:hypothetical protein